MAEVTGTPGNDELKGSTDNDILLGFAICASISVHFVA